ncbi:DUF3011 domain-containing protein [Luteibacter sp. PPL201]|uniref:DUF3011 domain-containing protein n=1 Tax=Luteibacter sahnii TaxID=3021977 RepID=A0ABT6B6E4_9GAMM
MRAFLYGLAVAALAVAAGTASPVAQAQSYGYGGDTRDCGSGDNRPGSCRVGWRDARLVRQDSRAPCIRGQTWDIEDGVIWVNQGCRGIFAAAGGWGGGRPGWDGGRPGWGGDRPGWGGDRPGWGGGRYQEIDCGSHDNGRGFCPADTRGGVRLLRQNSDARCAEGYSWGATRDGIWVDRGCRGIFGVGGR